MSSRDVLFPVLALNEKVRNHVLNLLGKNGYPSVGTDNLDDLVASIKGKKYALIFVDSEAILAYGTWIVPQVRTACRECRLILLCSQMHRNFVQRVMELGAYGCIIEPYAEWELLTMVRPIIADLQLEKKLRALRTKRLDKTSANDNP